MNIRQAVDKYDRETAEYIVTYIDVLGTATRMTSCIENKKLALNKLFNLYKFIMETSEAIEAHRDIVFKVFSDNIVIARKLSTEPATRIDEIKSVLGCTSSFQCSCASDSVGWLVRGGVTIGQLFIDKDIVWGAALVKAHDLENKNAIYPRIIIDAEILPELIKHKELSGYIQYDFDNAPFLDYLSIWTWCGKILEHSFEQMKAAVPIKSQDIMQKLSWHMNYVNKALEKKKEKQRLSF